MSLTVQTYHKAQKANWDAFIMQTKNATFLFRRDFMDYHKERFDDASLMVYKNNNVIAVLPANKIGKTIYSHQGLTYGGLLFTEKLKFRDVLIIFKTVLKYLHENGIQTLEMKQLPSFYTKVPNDELAYIMFLIKAKLSRREALSVINLSYRLKLSKDRIEGHKRGVKNDLKIKEEEDFEAFWTQLLEVNLQKKHKTKPVHTLEEIAMLKQKFPNCIRQFNVYKNDKIVAGTTIFETEHVAHSQYISGNKDKNSLGSLDFLHVHLITHVFKNKAYFDFGNSNENNGKRVNEGLQYWKEGFGARTVTQDFYSITTEKYNVLETVML